MENNAEPETEEITNNKEVNDQKDQLIPTLDESTVEVPIENFTIKESTVEPSKIECNEKVPVSEPALIPDDREKDSEPQLVEDLTKVVIEEEQNKASIKKSFSENDFKLEAMEVLGIKN